MRGPVRVGVFGAPLDTGNLGVSALGISTLRGLETVLPQLEVTLFDYGRGRRRHALRAADWSRSVGLEGCAYSRRFYRPSNQQQLYAAARLGLRNVHPVLRRLRRLDAILDISGGDSFADLYGDWRFRAVSMPKRLALALDLPLILLPQTYGPFDRETSRDSARRILCEATQSWARDEHSLDVVRDLLGPSFDATRHRAGVDVAFGLPSAEPDDPGLRDALGAFRAANEVVLGLNVSGLLYYERERAEHGFGLRRPYAEIILELAEALLAEPGRGLLLVPHVCPPCTPDEDDASACRAVFERLGPELQRRTQVVPALDDAMQAKWVVGHCDWFCGARMHSCIAGLSQGIPTAAIAYSDKSLGVFETAASGDSVFDARALDAKALVDGIVASVAKRQALAERLRTSIDDVAARWRQQFEDIGAVIAPGG